MNKKEKLQTLKKLKELMRKFTNVPIDDIGKSGLMTLDEQIVFCIKTLDDYFSSKASNSTRVNKKEKALSEDHFYLSFLSDTHSREYLLEEFFKELNSIGGKCMVLGDITNGGTLAGDKLHHLQGARDVAVQPKQDKLLLADFYKRYSDMFLGGIDGNHEKWSSDYTDMYFGEDACKMAGIDIDKKYAQNIQIVVQRVTHNGKVIPFTFLIIHGTGMPANTINSIKKSLSKAMSFNVDAIIYGHTHKLGSASLSILNKDGNGKWIKKQVTTYNPGSILETSEYADEAGYPANKPFDGSLLRCSVVDTKDGKGYKKVIDMVNIKDIISEKDRKLLKTLKDKLALIEAKNYNSKEEISEQYNKLIEQYKSKNINITQNNGHYFIGISGTSDLYSPYVSKDIKEKIRQDLKYAVEVAQQIPNVSVVLNGDLIFDYNKGYINKKDYCADIIADIQDLTEILKPVADKVVVINNGKMEESIMKDEKGKAQKRINSGKSIVSELARYATHLLQLDKKLAYAPYDKQEMIRKQIGVRNDQIKADNDAALAKAYDDYMKKATRNINNDDALDKLFEKDDTKIKAALVKKLRKEHEILDPSNPDDKEFIDERYPLSAIDLREPNDNLIGNIFCKMLGSNHKKISVNNILNYPATFKFKDTEGKKKIANAYYCTSVANIQSDLSTRLSTSINPADVVILNSAVSPTGKGLNEWTIYERISYMDENAVKRSKDVVVINAGSFAYSKYLLTGRVPTNMVYKVFDGDPLFYTFIPKHSVNYPGDGLTQYVEKLNFETVLKKYSITEKILAQTVNQSAKKTYEKLDVKKSKQENAELINELNIKLNN